MLQTRLSDAVVLSDMAEVYKIDKCILECILVDFPQTQKFLIQKALQEKVSKVNFCSEAIIEEPTEAIDRVQEIYSLALMHMIKNNKQQEELDFRSAIQDEEFEIKQDYMSQMNCDGHSQMNILTADILDTIEDQQGVYQQLEEFNQDMKVLASNSITMTQLLQLVYLENMVHNQFLRALSEVSEEVGYEIRRTHELIDEL